MFSRLLGVVVSGLLLTSAAQAATVRSFSMQELVDRSAVVFEGKVIGTRVVQGASPKEVRTLVTFEVLDSIKGASGQTVELSFFGGEINGRGVKVSDLYVPAFAERGVYFVERTDGKQLNPLYGWEQGHFVVGTDSKVSTRSGKPVFAAERDGAVPPSSISDGVARGVVTQPLAVQSQPLDVSQFKAEVRGMLK